MTNDFEIVKSRRIKKKDAEIEVEDGGIVDFQSSKNGRGKDKLLGAVADNFERIVDIASDIVEIEKMNAQADSFIRELKEKRRMLAEEADAYVKKIKVETDATVSKVEAIRLMMQDYYLHGKEGLTGEEFSKIIQEVINQIGISNE